jgi:hypothetical protein
LSSLAGNCCGPRESQPPILSSAAVLLGLGSQRGHALRQGGERGLDKPISGEPANRTGSEVTHLSSLAGNCCGPRESQPPILSSAAVLALTHRHLPKPFPRQLLGLGSQRGHALRQGGERGLDKPISGELTGGELLRTTREPAPHLIFRGRVSSDTSTPSAFQIYLCPNRSHDSF